jgi:pimeloyl-ACP methyl ester carboxylesterase
VSRTRYARSGESRIAYELRDTRLWWRPWLVLIQGMGFDRHGWEPVLRTLRRHLRLVLVDNRGSGRSSLPHGSFSVADMAGDILAVLDGAGISRAHVMGVSLGGMVAQELAIDHPDRVGDLVLVSTTPGWPFAYPMPAVSAALIARTGSLTREVAARRHAENALSARTVVDRPEVADRLVALQDMRLADPRAWAPRRPPALATPAVYGKRASVPARWSCTDPRTPSSTRAMGSCSRTASRARSS